MKNYTINFYMRSYTQDLISDVKVILNNFRIPIDNRLNA